MMKISQKILKMNTEQTSTKKILKRKMNLKYNGHQKKDKMREKMKMKTMKANHGKHNQKKN